MKKHKVLSVIAILAILMQIAGFSSVYAYYTTQEYSEELVINSSLKQNDDGWSYSGCYASWEKEQGVESGYVRAEATGIYPSVGQRVEKMEVADSNTGRKYEISFRIKSEGQVVPTNGSYAMLGIEYPETSSADNSKKAYYYNVTTPIDTKWQEFSFTMTHEGGKGIPYVYVRQNTIANGDGTYTNPIYYVDDLSVKEIVGSQCVNENNLLANDNFSNGMEGWQVYGGTAQPQGDGVVYIRTSKATEEITQNGDFPSLNQNDITLQAGHTYQIKAKYKKADDGSFFDSEGAMVYLPPAFYEPIAAEKIEKDQWFSYSRIYSVGDANVSASITFRVNAREYYAKDLQILDITGTAVENADFSYGIEDWEATDAWMGADSIVQASWQQSGGIGNSACAKVSLINDSQQRGIGKPITAWYAKQIYQNRNNKKYLLSAMIKMDPGKTGQAYLCLDYSGQMRFSGSAADVGDQWVKLNYLFDYETVAAYFGNPAGLTESLVPKIQVVVVGTNSYYIDDIEIREIENNEIQAFVSSKSDGSHLNALVEFVNNTEMAPEDNSITPIIARYSKDGQLQNTMIVPIENVYSVHEYCIDHYGVNLPVFQLEIENYDPDTENIKLFLWENTGSMQPYMRAMDLT